MNLKFDRADLLLEAGQVVRLHDAMGTQVKCLRGALWITQHDDRDDHLIGAGDALRLDRPGLVLIHAVESTEVVLSEPAARPSLSGRIARALVAALRVAGRWIVRRFGPEAINDRHWRGWYGAL
ncbi:MAG TPA: DUF2917 domain-containing protein [Burkholderiales bacterium]|nr:DUF2917 domain-containing protein [Burkholderiales bacterium]